MAAHLTFCINTNYEVVVRQLKGSLAIDGFLNVVTFSLRSDTIFVWPFNTYSIFKNLELVFAE